MCEPHPKLWPQSFIIFEVCLSIEIYAKIVGTAVHSVTLSSVDCHLRVGPQLHGHWSVYKQGVIWYYAI